MSLDAATKQQFGFEYQAETKAAAASTDSGIISDLVQENRNISNNSPTSDTWLSGISSPKHVVLELDDGTEDEILNEIVSKTDDANSFATSLRQLKEHGFEGASVPQRLETLISVKNRKNDDESPKSHLIRRTRLHDFNFNVNKRTSIVFQTDESLKSRKRSSVAETTVMVMPKRRKFGKCSVDKLRNDNTTVSNSNSKGQQSSLHLFLRVQSPSSETTNFSRSTKIALPQFLHVDYSLETVNKPQIESVAFKSVSGKVVAKLMTSMSNEEFSKKYILVDCRYPYEYNGGHLRGAINIFDTSRLSEFFFPDSEEQFRETSSKIPIFYCEYSQKRGPRMADALRQADRKRNEDRYPEVDYKEIYLLDRGYKKFFEEDRFVHLCEPQSYTEMTASSHKEDLKRYQLHKSKSVSNLTTNSSCLGSKRDLLRVRSKFWSVVDGLTSPDKSFLPLTKSSSLSCSFSSPPKMKACRGSMFSSPPLQQISKGSPNFTSLKQLDAYS